MQTYELFTWYRTNFQPIEYHRAFRRSVNKTVPKFERQNRDKAV